LVPVSTRLAFLFVSTSVFLLFYRDRAPVCGHLSPLAGAPHQ